MTAQALYDAHIASECAVERGADVVERSHLQHEMMQVFGKARTKRHRVVARIDVQECDVDLEVARQRAPDVVAETKAQDLLEVRSRLGDVVGTEREMTDALLARDEPGRDLLATERGVGNDRPVK